MGISINGCVIICEQGKNIVKYAKFDYFCSLWTQLFQSTIIVCVLSDHPSAKVLSHYSCRCTFSFPDYFLFTICLLQISMSLKFGSSFLNLGIIGYWKCDQIFGW